MKAPRSKLTQATLAIAFVFTAIGGGALFGSVALSQDAQHPPDRSARPMIGEMPQDLAQSFEVLRRDRTADDNLPGRLPEAGQSGEQTQLGVNPGLARRVATTPDDGAVYVIPGRDEACVITTRHDMPMAMGCAVTARFRVRGVWLTQAMSRTADGRRVQGVVPDGVSRIRITRAEQDAVDAAVSDNGFSLDVQGQPQQLSWVGRDGSVMHTESLE